MSLDKIGSVTDAYVISKRIDIKQNRISDPQAKVQSQAQVQNQPHALAEENASTGNVVPRVVSLTLVSYPPLLPIGDTQGIFKMEE